MGTVYLAEDTHLGRRVAIKFPSVNSLTVDYRARFLREARAVSELSHPAIATLFDYGEADDGRPFLVMELARGRTLAEVIRNGELNLPRAIEMVCDVATALAEAHSRGVIHRDVKPSNIMIDERGQVKVLDFGLAKQLQRDHVLNSEPEAPTLVSTETRSGVVLGTPAYLSPEQAMGLSVDGRSDLFALGIVLYESITGRTPFHGGNFIEIAANVLHFEPTPPSQINPIVPKALDFVVRKALAKKPEKRYQSANDLVADLKSVREHLDANNGQTLIKQTSPSIASAQGKTLRTTYTNISQILQRPSVPILYLIIGAIMLMGGGWLTLRLLRPGPYKPSAEAQRWYEVGTNAIRDTAYYQASQALGRATAADDGFMLAHARLAEALVELDYVDSAKNELLRVTSADRSRLSPVDAIYLDAITATARNDFAQSIERYREIVELTPENEKAFVLVDLGRAYKNNNEAKKAIESFSEATTRNPQYATAYLHLGILHGQQGDTAAAMAAFEKAESIYQALGNLEGRAEVVLQRGALFNKLNQLTEARVQLDHALALAKASDNKSQTIKTLLQLSSVSTDFGETGRAVEYAREAVELAQRNGMENLSAQGLIDLGNSFLVRGEIAEAEEYFLQALESAERVKARRNAARARVSLANVSSRRNDQDAALRYIEPALAFYKEGGYLTESFACLALLARVKLKNADYSGAASAHDELFQVAERLNDQSLLSRAHAERGSALNREEKFTEALDHLNQAFAGFNAQGQQRSMGNNLANRGKILWILGRFQESEVLLDQALSIADRPGGEQRELSAEIKLAFAELAQTQERFADARQRAENVLATTSSRYPEVTLGAKRVLGLAQAYSGAVAVGRQTNLEALELARTFNEPLQLARAKLALAEVMLLANDPQAALTNALEARAVFARGEQRESEWRAVLIAALASLRLGDSSKAREYGAQAEQAIQSLQQRLGADNYNSYLGRPDVQGFRRQLNQFVPASGL